MRHPLSRLRHILTSGTVAVTLWSLPLMASAQANPSIIPASWTSGDCNITTGILKAKCIPMFIGNLIAVVFSVVSAFFLLNVIYAGYQIALGSWTGEKSEGKDRLTWSIIGLIVCVCAFLILDLVVSVIIPTS
jgi:hypothetical protein